MTALVEFGDVAHKPLQRPTIGFGDGVLLLADDESIPFGRGVDQGRIHSIVDTGDEAARWQPGQQRSRVGGRGQPRRGRTEWGRESAAADAPQRGPTLRPWSSHSVLAMALVVSHSLARPSALLLHLRRAQPSHASRASREPSLASTRPFSSSSQLPGLQPLLTQTRVRGVSATRSMAGGREPQGWGGETDGRPEMLASAPYSPPPWASDLHPVPVQFTSLGQVSQRMSIASPCEIPDLGLSLQIWNRSSWPAL